MIENMTNNASGKVSSSLCELPQQDEGYMIDGGSGASMSANKFLCLLATLPQNHQICILGSRHNGQNRVNNSYSCEIKFYDQMSLLRKHI